MAEAIALQALEWVASSITHKFIEKTVSYLGADLAKELEDLETTIFPQFQLVIKAAESSPHKHTVAKWLSRLKNAYYMVEDIIDELEYQRLQSEVTNENKDECASTSRSIFKPLKKLYHKVHKKISSLSPTQRKLWDQLQELKIIAEESKTLCDLLKINAENNVNPIPTSFKGPKSSASILINRVIGRDLDRDHIIDLLVGEQVGESNPSIGITGVGGAGKTTLAQFIFNDTRIKNCFNVRIWVCLTPKLDVIRHTKEMIESASKKSPQLDSIDSLQRTLNDILLNSKTLLMLDDICYNGQTEDEEWSQLLAPFTSNVQNHRILLTSRSNALPITLYPINHISLKELKASDFKSLFRYFAFRDAKSEQIKELEEIGDKIVEKLSGSPLAAKAVASQLSKNLDYREWRNTLDTVNLSNVSDSLLWTYQRLDAPLQRCFLYCSIFPKGSCFNEIELVNLWLCENFIKCSEETYDVKEIAKEYFNELIACSFFLPLGIEQNSSYEYKIHDLFHDLAEKLSKEDCFRIKDDGIPREIPYTVRYISISISELKEEHISIISKLDQVRTVFFEEPFVNDVNDVFKQLLSKLKKLRVLVLCFYNHVQLPELVGELKHLRYLDTIRSSISEYPDSLCKLYHLQVLLLSTSVKKLPGNLSNLKMLRYLEMLDDEEKPVGTVPSIANIGNLTLLETVRQFQVRKENGFELRQLGNLKRLKGVLRIENLENCNRIDAIEAKLRDKKDLERLELVWEDYWKLYGLVWGDYGKLEADFDLEVIERLQPHENLKHLLLENYRAARYPSWLLKNSVYSFALTKCMYLQVLPSNLTHCDKLVLIWNCGLRDLSHLPEKLTSLTIEGCPALAFAPTEKKQSHSQDLSLNEAEFVAYWLPFINQLKLPIIDLTTEIIMLQFIPMPQKNDYYEYLQIYKSAILEGDQPLDEQALQAWWYCHQQRMDFVYNGSVNAPQFILPSTLTTLDLRSCNITDGALADCLIRLTSLNELRLESIMTLTTLPSENVMLQLKSLKCLYVAACWCLRSLGFLPGLVSLEKLEVGLCPCLDIKHTTDRSTFPVSLESLFLWGCVIRDGIFRNCDMPCLNTFKINRCRGSKFLSIGMLTALRELMLWDYPDLCKVEGLQSLPSLNDLILIELPNFQAESLLETPMDLCWQKLEISSLEMLKALSTNNAFASLEYLFIKECQEETFTPEVLEVLARIPSLYQLTFDECKIKDLPNSLKELSGLKYIEFIKCPEISLVPELPESIREIYIEKCPVLKERCRAPDGPDWSKIAQIPYKRID